jgi:hypothetical protein
MNQGMSPTANSARLSGVAGCEAGRATIGKRKAFGQPARAFVLLDESPGRCRKVDLGAAGSR